MCLDAALAAPARALLHLALPHCLALADCVGALRAGTLETRLLCHAACLPSLALPLVPRGLHALGYVHVQYGRAVAAEGDLCCDVDVVVDVVVVVRHLHLPLLHDAP